MPKVFDHIDALFGELEAKIEAAWPGQVKVFRGVPLLEITHDLLPCSVMTMQDIPFEPSGAVGSKATLNVMILGIHPVPSDKTLNIQMEQIRLADLLVEEIESQPGHVWANGEATNAYVNRITTDYMDEEEMIRVMIEFSCEVHCLLGT